MLYGGKNQRIQTFGGKFGPNSEKLGPKSSICTFHTNADHSGSTEDVLACVGWWLGVLD